MGGAEVLELCAVLEHVVGRGEDRGSNRADRLLRTATARQAVELGSEIAVLLAPSGPGTLDT